MVLHSSLDAVATLLCIAMISSCAEATDCTQTPDLLENCDQWTACVKSAGVGCYVSPGLGSWTLATITWRRFRNLIRREAQRRERANRCREAKRWLRRVHDLLE